MTLTKPSSEKSCFPRQLPRFFCAYLKRIHPTAEVDIETTQKGMKLICKAKRVQSNDK